MNGHEPLIAMRLAGKIPQYVFLEDSEGNPQWHLYGEFPTISVKGDALKTLDMRFLVGLAVLASSESEKRCKDLLEVCKRHKVRYAVVNQIRLDQKRWEQTGFFETYGEL